MEISATERQLDDYSRQSQTQLEKSLDINDLKEAVEFLDEMVHKSLIIIL